MFDPKLHLSNEELSGVSMTLKKIGSFPKMGSLTHFLKETPGVCHFPIRFGSNVKDAEEVWDHHEEGHGPQSGAPLEGQ